MMNFIAFTLSFIALQALVFLRYPYFSDAAEVPPLEKIDSERQKCTSPVGIDDGSGITTKMIHEILDGTKLGMPLPYLFLPLAEDLISALATTFETPIQFRLAVYHGMTCYNAVAMFHPTALDVWGKADLRICTDDFTSDEQKRAHEEDTSAYVFAYSAMTLVPSVADTMRNIMDNVLGLPMSKILEGNDLPTNTPWGLAKAAVDQMTTYSKSDGWNADGNLSNQFSKMPYSDFDIDTYSRYKPMQSKK